MSNINTVADQAIAYHGTFATGHTRLRVILTGLRLEIKIPGMRMTRKAPKCSTILRKEFGLSGKPPSLLAQYEALLRRHGVIAPPAAPVAQEATL